MIERWRDVAGYEGFYQVSDQGRVRSVSRVVPHKRYGSMKLKGRILRPGPCGSGHVQVVLCKDGVKRYALVHRLVLASFVGPCPAGKECLHGPAGVSDNSVSNLKWGSHKENGSDMRRDGTHNGRAVIRSDGVEFINMHVAAEGSGCSNSGICDCCNGRGKTAGGFGWRYKHSFPAIRK